MLKLQASAVFGRALDDNADALAGALWKTYDAGTTDPVTTYSDAARTVANAFPVAADSAGRFPDIYVAPGNYRIRLETSAGALIVESDNNVVYGLDPGEPAAAKFKTVAQLEADETLGYSLGGSVTVVVEAGDLVEAGGIQYTVAASAATDNDFATAGGVKLYFDDLTSVTNFFASAQKYPANTIVRTRAEGFAYRAVDAATATTVANAGGQAFDVLSEGGISAGGRVNERAYAVAASGLGADNTQSLQNALDNHDTVTIDRSLRLDGMVEINANTTLILSNNAELVRTSDSADTRPVLWLKGFYASAFGTGLKSGVRSENRAPNGVVRIGHKDLTESHASLGYCSIGYMTISGNTFYGQTTGSPDQALALYNPQIDNLTSYFHHISDLRLKDANTGLGLNGLCNANKIRDIELFRCGNSTADQYRKAIHINGAQENEIRGVFHHFSPDAWTVYQEILDNTGNGGGVNTPRYNDVIICSEQGGSSARPLFAADSGSQNCYRVKQNTALGNSVPSDFYGSNNRLDSNGDIAARFLRGAGELTELSTSGSVSFDSGAGFGLTGSGPTSAILSKSDNTSGAAEVSFSLSNSNPGAVNRHGFLKVTTSAQDTGLSLSKVAWYYCSASANNSTFPAGFAIVDSGGNTTDFTVSLSSGILSVSSTLDSLVASVEYANAIGGVSIT